MSSATAQIIEKAVFWLSHLAEMDRALLQKVNAFVGTSPVIDEVARWLVSDYLVPVALALALVAMWFMERDRNVRIGHQIGVYVALTSMALSSLAVFIVNIFYFRPRPFVDLDVELLFYRPTDSSFPSNAVAAVFGIAFGIWGVNRRIGWLAIGAATVYALARVFAGVHYPLDVVGGAAIAIPVTFLVFRMRDLLMPVLVWTIKLARIIRLA